MYIYLRSTNFHRAGKGFSLSPQTITKYTLNTTGHEKQIECLSRSIASSIPKPFERPLQASPQAVKVENWRTIQNAEFARV